MPNDYTPNDFHTVTPYLIVPDPSQVIAFAKEVFGAEERMSMKDDTGQVRHAEIRIGDSVVEMGGVTEQWKAMPAALHVYVPDVDATHAKALAAGGTELHAPMDQFYGERSSGVADPAGNQWFIATKTEDLTMEEMERRAAEMGEKAG